MPFSARPNARVSLFVLTALGIAVAPCMSGCGSLVGFRKRQQAQNAAEEQQEAARLASLNNEAAAGSPTSGTASSAPVTRSGQRGYPNRPTTSVRFANAVSSSPSSGGHNEEYFSEAETPVTFTGGGTTHLYSNTRNDHRQSAQAPALNLFGEIDGVGGQAGPFGASENVVQVTFSVEGKDFNPDVNSTGTHLVYSSTQHSRTSDIYSKAIGGQAVTQLTSDPADDIMPCYSPDDTQIAFASNRNGNWDIFIMSCDGGTAVQVTNDTANEIHPSWSPDGRNLVFCRLGEQSGRWELWVTELANPARKHFIGYGLFPEWNPDPNSNKIAFQKARERGSRLFSVWTIEYVDGQGSLPTEVASAANAATIGPSWSCDGKMLAFSTIVDPDQVDENTDLTWADVWVISADGSDRVNITNGQFTNSQPTWGPNGTMYFVSNRSGTDTIWAIEPNRAIDLARSGGAGAGRNGTTMGNNPAALAEVPENAPRSGEPN